MRVLVQIITGFSCFLFFVTFGQGQEIKCTAPEIPNGIIIDRKPEYNKDDTLKYRCSKGFEPREGTPKCASFGWTLKPECDAVTCELKSTTYEVKSIKPEGQTIFQIGESVEITCTESSWFFRTKETKRTFTCQDNAEWDGYPVCQEIKCEVPYNQHVYYPTYYFSRDKSLGAEIRYSCDDGYVNNNNAEKATCTRDGWTPKPLCVERTCAAPEIPNAEIEGGLKQNYRINSRIQYRCRPGFKPQQLQQITCDSQGRWTIIQQCTTVTCELKSTTFRVKSIKPEGQTIFRAGESVEITCTDRSWFRTKETKRTYTCQDNGEWDNTPVCEEIKCEVPYNQNVYYPDHNFRGDKSLGAEIRYSCDYGYVKNNDAEKATCTGDGWTPNPLCVERTCAAPEIPNAEIEGGLKQNYRINSRIQYRCHPGFEPQQLQQITCDANAQWTNTRQCTKLCEAPVIPNALIEGRLAQYYRTGSKIKYKCGSGFEPQEVQQITCDSQGQWIGMQNCADGNCQEQELKNVKIVFGHPSTTLPYKPGHALVFQCTDDNMRFYGQRAIECQPDGRWNYPFPQCGGTVQCSHPTKNLQFVRVTDEKTVYRSSEILKYSCNEPYNETAEGVLMCQDGKWNGTFDCKSKTCPPPPYVEHGDFSISSSTDDKVITAVSYMCQSYYLLNKQQESYKCVDGIWETPPKCLRPCVIDDIVEKYNLKPPPEKVYLMHGNKYKLDCRDGWKAGSEMKAHVDVTCSDGNLQIQQSCNTQK